MSGKGTLVVNLFGGPAAGKSTTAAGVFSLLKLHDVECELVTEFAKDLVWEERYKAFGDQHYIFGEQHHRMWCLLDNVDVMIADSPLMLSTIYRLETLSKSFTQTVIDVVNSFNNLNIFLNRTRRYNPNGRNETEDEAKKLDVLIQDILTKYSMSYKEVPSSHHGINKVVQLVLNRLNIEQKFNVDTNL